MCSNRTIYLNLVTNFDNFDSFLSGTSRDEVEGFSFSVIIEEAEESVEVLCVDIDAAESADLLDLRGLCGGGPTSQCDVMVKVLV